MDNLRYFYNWNGGGKHGKRELDPARREIIRQFTVRMYLRSVRKTSSGRMSSMLSMRCCVGSQRSKDLHLLLSRLRTINQKLTPIIKRLTSTPFEVYTVYTKITTVLLRTTQIFQKDI
ncbi:Hypothetical predicted protein [Mytilus galloprovincialis]|uniref:Uncharacterized protein n=1 Tax=Mytilus galloprovincialis TaxID=29158 RepID=A0A8B6FXP1_MYTGA|nr:Hypothetical predicted protein [Mytilus galloprovincialis]